MTYHFIMLALNRDGGRQVSHIGKDAVEPHSLHSIVCHCLDICVSSGYIDSGMKKKKKHLFESLRAAVDY